MNRRTEVKVSLSVRFLYYPQYFSTTTFIYLYGCNYILQLQSEHILFAYSGIFP